MTYRNAELPSLEISYPVPAVLISIILRNVYIYEMYMQHWQQHLKNWNERIQKETSTVVLKCCGLSPNPIDLYANYWMVGGKCSYNPP